MSVDLNWEGFTGGPDGAALAESIRAFIHERFQTLPLPKLIRSVHVHGFEFGEVAPEIVLKDICDPLHDFYEGDGTTDDDDDDDDNDNDAKSAEEPVVVATPGPNPGPEASRAARLDRGNVSRLKTDSGHPLNTNLSLGTTPGVFGTTSNLGYFHLPLSAGLPGSQTPLAAFAGAHFPGGHRLAVASSLPPDGHRHADSFSSISPPPSSLDHTGHDRHSNSVVADDLDGAAAAAAPASILQSRPDIGPEDLQVVFQVTYSGDVQLSLTADVFLDYPMPSFVGIPLKLKITGLTFNGVGILAYIKRKAHLCFLNPEDAEALVGGEAGLTSLDEPESPTTATRPTTKVGALLEDIRIESEMGETDSGKQVLKNVGKIEKFILEQIQRIFEDEFVYPSFWTFLV